MKADDDEDEDTSIGVGHYPTLPSLVALQQMRNRLHMAQDGKRLMKWSAMATGRELRRIAEELQRTLKEFNDEVRDAFILLARCRYFFPNFNRMTLESVGNHAPVTVDFTQKALSGVRIASFLIIESGVDPFPCLGIEKGGIAIAEAKRAWLELLKHLVMILQLRESFMMIDIAHANATKKSNVLGKIIIPRTEATIKYILAELEELEREEFFRLKKVLEIKVRRRKKKGDECPLCLQEAREGPPEKIKPKCIVCKGPLKVEVKDTKKIDLKQQLDTIVKLTKEYEQKGIEATNVAEFKKIAEQLQKKLEMPPIPANVDQSKLCDLCMKRFLEQGGKAKPQPPGKALPPPPTPKPPPPKPPPPPAAKPPPPVAKPPPPPPPPPAAKPPPPPPPPQPAKAEIVPSAASVKSEQSKKVELTVPSADPSVGKSASIKIESKTIDTKSSEPLCDKHTAAVMADLELGVFETDTKEIVKIVRRRNEDGTITEERKVIRIKKETRSPAVTNPDDENSRVMFQSSETSSKSNPYSDKKTIGAVSVPKRHYYDIKPREVQSEYTPRALPIANPVARYCMSSTSMITIDLEFESVCVSLLSVPKYVEDVSNNLREYVTSSTEFDQLLNSFEPSYNNDLASTSKKQQDDSGYSTLCSDNTLVSDNSKDNKGKLEETLISDVSLIKHINSSDTIEEETKSDLE